MSRIWNNPYSNVDWHNDGFYKADHHVHWRGFGDEPADTLDVLADGVENEGHSLPQDEWYEVLGAGSQAESEDCYWGPNGADSGYHDMSDTNSDYSDRDAENLGLDGIIEYPSQEIDDVEHICHLFATSSPQDFDYYPGSGGSNGNIEDFAEALPQVIEDEDHTVVDGRGQVVIPHPTRHMDSADEWDRYLEFFENYSLAGGLLGLEIFTKSLGSQGNHYGDGLNLDDVFEIWDSLMLQTMPERPIWGFAANDCNFGDWGHGAGPDQRWWTVALSDDEFDPTDQHASRLALKDALEEGRFWINQRQTYDHGDPNDAPQPPTLNEIDVDHDTETITLDITWPEQSGQIDWYSNNAIVETGETIEIEDAYTPFVRAHAYYEDNGDMEGEIATQPFTVVEDDYEPPDTFNFSSMSTWDATSESEWSLT
ncbi:hypothetical protein [Halostagnicola sp. A-GB9-2]|uniref:hypothetical protein n=1 Tax=Halostagnicola sp. A-GB9-2 TaxID=3048066 RepID=UPI0024BF1F79|nr:hypothetical protein [Halostagnicola sp. A-GB9-2]MDJ1433577.1 hypothetical protein [Halostagnicola sp. A-GB9-2]